VVLFISFFTTLITSITFTTRISYPPPSMLTTILFNFTEALLIALVVMTLIWAVTEWLENSSLVDAAWSLTILALSLHFAAQPEGFIPRDVLTAALAAFWAIRLSVFIFMRNHGKGEDPRYADLKTKWGEKRKLKMLQFFWAQGAAAVLFTIPFILTGVNSAHTIHPLEWSGALLVFIAVLGETSADLSLACFKKNPANRGKTCRAGLWNYSRHPNYFFEWLVWVGFALLATPSPLGAFAWLCPAAMLHFLLNVTGIPKTEEQALKSRGEDYREYQKTTSKFIPWFKQK
jgi:steroid 5-alpha reductase family enzyme